MTSIVRLLGPSASRAAGPAANGSGPDKLLVACAASVLRDLAAMDLHAAALKAGLTPPPHHSRVVSGSLEAMQKLELGLVHVTRLRGLSPAQMEKLARWIERAEPAVGEYLAVVDWRAIERDQTHVLRELGLLLGLDGRAVDVSDLNGPALMWTETLRTIDGLEPGLGRRHQLRFSDPTQPVP